MNVPNLQTPPTPPAKFYLFTLVSSKLRCLLRDYFQSVFRLCAFQGRWKCLKVGGASSGWDHGERVEREPRMGVWGRSPQRGPGAEPLVGVRGAKPP